jgi:uncharacterized protein YdhG (YjbR/CyaY superfamily)
MAPAFKDINGYIAQFPAEVRVQLEKLRVAIHKAAPQAQECISYGMPAFKLHTVLVYFAANKNHLGFYPTSSPIVVFEKELKKFVTSKGAVQFPFNQPLPVELIQRMVKYRVQQDTEKAAEKNIKKNQRTCANGHTYIKSSDCPTCPKCEKERKPEADFLSAFGTPARRALENAGITTLKKLRACTEAQLLALHGFGPSSLPKVKQVLKALDK